MQIGWFYFKIKITKTVENPLLKEKTDNHVLNCALLPNVTTSNELCHAAINDIKPAWHFEVQKNLELNI